MKPKVWDYAGSQEDPSEAVRVLVQTRTHLLRGEGYYDKLNFILDMVCELLWGRFFLPQRDRFHVYGPPFSRTNRRVYFLVDHGQAYDNSTVPVLWYRYNGGEDPLERILHPLPEAFRTIVQEYPFTPRPKEDQPNSAEPSDKDMREGIRFDLYDERPLRKFQITFLIEHPEHAEWVKNHSEPRFWTLAEAAIKKLQEASTTSIQGSQGSSTDLVPIS